MSRGVAATRGAPDDQAEVVQAPRPGRGWEEWFDLLDQWDAAERPHKEIARWLRDEQGVDGWGAQSVTGGYERARGLRAVGEPPEGFSITASKTVAVPVDRLYDAFVDEALRARWLRDGELRERTATKPKSARFDRGDGRTRVVVGFARARTPLVAANDCAGAPAGRRVRATGMIGE